jgi:hypothetical protein
VSGDPMGLEALFDEKRQLNHTWSKRDHGVVSLIPDVHCICHCFVHKPDLSATVY